jgi:hypothetical protein
MLATCGLFFDFITGRVTAEQITEQYYNDVVAIATVKEFRTIDLGDGESWSIEDAPTFSLSLASGERRTVTFVNQDYFTGIKSKIVELTQDLDESTRINWVSGAEQVADSAVKAIRYYLRLHKGMSDEQ